MIYNKHETYISGIVSVEGDKIIISVADVGDINLADYISDYVGEDTKIVLTCSKNLK
jgi:hypothetical protein